MWTYFERRKQSCHGNFITKYNQHSVTNQPYKNTTIMLKQISRTKTQIQIWSVTNCVTWTEGKEIVVWYRSQSDSCFDADEESRWPSAGGALRWLHRQQVAKCLLSAVYLSFDSPTQPKPQFSTLRTLRTLGKIRLYSGTTPARTAHSQNQV